MPALPPRSPADPAAALSWLASACAQTLAVTDPLLGEHRLQVAVDRFVDAAIGALDAIAQAGDAHGADEGEVGRGIPDRRPGW